MALRLFGWGFRGEVPAFPRYVIVAAPHTSNWDFLVMVAYTRMLGIKVSWIGKHTLFRGALGAFFHAAGGVPVDRTKRQNFVDQIVAEYGRREGLVLIITPEGTRGRRGYWKSGFYHIARRAGVPVVLASVDYVDKLVEFGPTIRPAGDIEADMEIIRGYYDGKRGRHPEKMGEIRFKEDEED